MWIVKENLVGSRVRVVQRHDDKILWRCVVREIGIQNGFRLLVEITEILQEQGTDHGMCTRVALCADTIHTGADRNRTELPQDSTGLEPRCP